MGKDIDYFLEHPEEFDQLSADDQAKITDGGSIEGEISSVPPDAAATDDIPDQNSGEVEKVSGAQGREEDTVVLAKDGTHTIPFEELQRAREQAKYWEEQARSAIAQQQAERQPDKTPEIAPTNVDLKELRRELREAALQEDEDREAEIQEKVDAEILRRAEEAAYQRIERRDADARQRAAESAVQQAASKAIADYPFLDHTSPDGNQEAIAQVQALSVLYANKGDAPADALSKAVEKVAGMYGMSTSQSESESAASGDVEAKAAAAIAKAKSPLPNSMSSIPAAAAPHHDEAEALLSMSPAKLAAKFSGMTPDQIEAALSRVL